MDKKYLWIVIGITGCGKTTLLNEISDSHGSVSDSAVSVTDLIYQTNTFYKPLKCKQKNNRYYSDSVGFGDTDCKDMEELLGVEATIMTRILKGVTGIIFCIEHKRLSILEKFQSKILQYVENDIPIIICFTKGDQQKK